MMLFLRDDRDKIDNLAKGLMCKSIHHIELNDVKMV